MALFLIFEYVTNTYSIMIKITLLTLILFIQYFSFANDTVIYNNTDTFSGLTVQYIIEKSELNQEEIYSKS